jgi:hypothetical protein
LFNLDYPDLTKSVDRLEWSKTIVIPRIEDSDAVTFLKNQVYFRNSQKLQTFLEARVSTTHELHSINGLFSAFVDLTLEVFDGSMECGWRLFRIFEIYTQPLLFAVILSETVMCQAPDRSLEIIPWISFIIDLMKQFLSAKSGPEPGFLERFIMFLEIQFETSSITDFFDIFPDLSSVELPVTVSSEISRLLRHFAVIPKRPALFHSEECCKFYEILSLREFIPKDAYFQISRGLIYEVSETQFLNFIGKMGMPLFSVPYQFLMRIGEARDVNCFNAFIDDRLGRDLLASEFALSDFEDFHDFFGILKLATAIGSLHYPGLKLSSERLIDRILVANLIHSISDRLRVLTLTGLSKELLAFQKNSLIESFASRELVGLIIRLTEMEFNIDQDSFISRLRLATSPLFIASDTLIKRSLEELEDLLGDQIGDDPISVTVMILKHLTQIEESLLATENELATRFALVSIGIQSSKSVVCEFLSLLCLHGDLAILYDFMASEAAEFTSDHSITKENQIHADGKRINNQTVPMKLVDELRKEFGESETLESIVDAWKSGIRSPGFEDLSEVHDRTSEYLKFLGSRVVCPVRSENEEVQSEFEGEIEKEEQIRDELLCELKILTRKEDTLEEEDLEGKVGITSEMESRKAMSEIVNSLKRQNVRLKNELIMRKVLGTENSGDLNMGKRKGGDRKLENADEVQNVGDKSELVELFVYDLVNESRALREENLGLRKEVAEVRNDKKAKLERLKRMLTNV